MSESLSYQRRMDRIFYFFIFFFFQVGVMPKEGWTSYPYPSFGMTTTQDIRDLFAWRRPHVG